MVSVEATFVPAFETYSITYVSLKGKGTYASTPKTVKEGNLLTVSVEAFGKYVIDTVTFNGEPMEYIGDNKYQILPHSSGEVEVVFLEKQASVDSSSESSVEENTQSEPSNTSKGCAGAVSSLGLINILSIPLLLLRKRKE